jgi:hypothetical protein
MATEAGPVPVIGDVSPKGTDADNAVEKEEDKISVGDMDEVNLEEGTAHSVVLRRYTPTVISTSIVQHKSRSERNIL